MFQFNYCRGFPRTNLVYWFVLLQLLTLFQSGFQTADGHLAALVQTDGKPNGVYRSSRRLLASNIQGKTPRTSSTGVAETELELPENIQRLFRGLVKVNNSPRTLLGDNSAYTTGMTRRVNKKMNGAGINDNDRILSNNEDGGYNNEKGLLDDGDDFIPGGLSTFGSNADQDEQQAAFTQYISARALSNIPQFFQHLRENLEALQTEEDDEDVGSSSVSDESRSDQDDYTLFPGSSAEFHKLASQHDKWLDSSDLDELKTKLRWQPLASGMAYHQPRHPHSIRSFTEPAAAIPSFPEFFLRRASTKQYNPSWAFTKMGLGKKRK